MRMCVIGACLALLAVQDVRGDDWLEWRGPNRDGKSAETGLMQSWPVGGPDPVWEIDGIGGGYSAPAVQGDRLYYLTNEGLENEYVRAASVKDGSTIWSTRIGKVGAPDQRPSYPGSRGMPTIDGKRVYALGSDGDLACLEAETGKVRWQLSFQSAFGSKPPRWAWAESPLIDGDRLICAPGGETATVVALNKHTGKVIWKCAVPGGDLAGYGSPVVATISGVRQYVIYLGGGVVGVEADTGKFLWRYDRTAQGSPANILTPVIEGDHVYTGSNRGGGALVRIRLKKDPIVKEVYHAQKLPIHVGGAVLLDGHLYGTTRSALLCVEYETGEIKWTDRSVGAATVGYADGRLYVVGDDGEVALVDPTPAGYREISRFTPPGREDGPVSWTYPVIANGRMYLRNVDRMWSYDIEAE